MSETTHEDILNTVMEEVEAPKPIPAGTWKLRLISAAYKEAQSKDDVDQALFAYVPVEAQENVDEADLAAAEWQGAKLWYRIRFDSPSQGKWNTRVHLEKHGIDMSGGLTLKGAFAAATKAKPEIFAEVGIRTYTSKQTGEIKADNTMKGFAPLT